MATLKPYANITETEIVKAMAHPMRVRILAILDERTASPVEIATDLGAPLQNVSYHVRQLAAVGLIELVSQTPRRGALEHHYRAVARRHIPDGVWARVPTLVKQATVGSALGEIGEQVQTAAMTGGFDSDDAHLTRTNVELDPEGWRELADEMNLLLDRVDHIQARSAARQANHADRRHGAVVAMLFETMAVAAEAGRPRPRKRKPQRVRRDVEPRA
jgi:DNA-binding transcriptional ArsR family regulator